MSPAFRSQLACQHRHTQARVVEVSTAHGRFVTPCFMPVGTRAVVNHMSPQELRTAGSQIILGGNTYHMLCAPGMQVIENSGGMHRFMGWDGPMLTDSGGFQVFSLSKNKKICTIDDHGAHFRLPNSNQVIHMTPSVSIATQKIIGADIIMAFDECTPEAGGRQAAEAALERTHRWLLESKEAHVRNPSSAYGYAQALFGIIQGGSFRDLRELSTQQIIAADLDGIAIGGEIIGFDMAKTREIIGWVRPLLPEHKLRYTMGVGLQPQDLLDVVAAGVDIFDCVAPTRNARHGALYHGKTVVDGDWLRFDNLGEEKGRLLIKKSCYALDNRPILEGCPCYTCQHYSRAYLHFLFKSGSTSYSQLACIHNISVMQQTCDAMRAHILQHPRTADD